MAKKAYYLHDFSYVSHSLDKNVLTVDTNGTVKLRAIVCNDDIIQVWMDQNGKFEKPDSYAVEKESWDFSDFTLSETDSEITLKTNSCAMKIQKSPMSFKFVNAKGEVLLEEYEKIGAGWREDGSVFLYNSMAKDEHFYGLGEDNDAFRGNLDRRGTVRDMITGQTITVGCVTADIPVTFFMSSGINKNGYGLFFDNTYHSTFDMGKESDDYYLFDAKGGELLFYFFNGPEFKKILSLYTDITGKPSLPPLWTTGYIQSKCGYFCWEEIEQAIVNLRKKQIPVDGVVIDAGWSKELNDFQVNPDKFVSMERWIEEFDKHMANGVKFMLSTAGPMIKKESSNYKSGVEANIFATDGNGNTVTSGWYGGELMDFTAPNMKEWLKPQMKPYHDAGVKSWWLDLIEPEGEPLQTVYQGGPRARIHNAFALLNTKVYYEILKEFDPDSRPFILGRTGTAGIQKYGSSTWTGDVYCDYDTLQAHCAEALNTGMSGIPNWTCDTGGFITSSLKPSLQLPSHFYNNDRNAQALLYERWLQLTCFAPVTRCHHVGPCEPYAHGSLVESSATHYLKLRYKLLPYIYTYAQRATVDGSSIMRPLVYEFQNDEKVYKIKDEFMFGDSLLVAPVLTENTTARKVYFPEGKWIDFDYGYEYEGPCEAIVYAPQDRIPVFVKSGAILPMIPEMNYSDEKPWDPIIYEIWPDGKSSFKSYLDDGKTMAYTRGEFTETEVEVVETLKQGIEITVTESNKKFTPSTYEFVVHVHNRAWEVTGLKHYDWLYKLEKAEEGWLYDYNTGLLHIKVKADESGVTKLNVKTDKFTLYKAPAPILGEDGRLLTDDEKNKATQLPYFFPPAAIPCRIQLQNFDRGGEGVAYHMNEKGNSVGAYRHEDVNIGTCNDIGGGFALINIENGEWVEYTVNVEERGTYNLKLRVASNGDGNCLNISFDGKNLTGKLHLPNTGSNEVWETVDYDHVTLQKGEQVIKITVEQGPVCLNYLDVEAADD